MYVSVTMLDSLLKRSINSLSTLKFDSLAVEPTSWTMRSEQLSGASPVSLEQPQTLLQNIITQKLYNVPADYWDTYAQKVADVTADDVQRVARKYIDLDHLQIVAVGDAKKAREVLAKYGKVEVYDTDGRPQFTQQIKNN